MNNTKANEEMFECKLYITDLETNKKSKEINVSDLIFNDYIEFEFGNYEDEDYGTLPYKDFKFFLNDYSVTFYSPQYKNAINEIDRLNNLNKQLVEECQKLDDEVTRLNNILDELEKYIKTEAKIELYKDKTGFRTFADSDDVLNKLKELKENK